MDPCFIGGRKDKKSLGRVSSSLTLLPYFSPSSSVTGLNWSEVDGYFLLLSLGRGCDGRISCQPPTPMMKEKPVFFLLEKKS